MWIECGLNLHRHPLIISLELDWVVTPQSRNEEAPIMHVFSDRRLDDAVQDAGGLQLEAWVAGQIGKLMSLLQNARGVGKRRKPFLIPQHIKMSF